MPITVVKGAVWDSANALEDTTPEAFRTDISVDRPVQSDSGTVIQAAADRNNLMRFTATTTYDLLPAATATNDFHVTVLADGGDVTLDPSGAETINGVASLVIPDGAFSVLFCNGTTWFAGVAATATAFGQSLIEAANAAAARTTLELENSSTILNNLTATADPLATDDSNDGYDVTSIWVNATLDTAFICADATVSAAVWIPVLQLGDENLYTAQQRMTLQTDTSSSGAVTFSFLGGDCFLDLTENVTSITISDLPENAWATLVIQQGSGGYTVTGWAAAVKWPGAEAPTISTTDNAYDVISFYKKGSDIIASISQDHR
jgi:hypothetical protein